RSRDYFAMKANAGILLLYADDHDGHLPPKMSSGAEIEPFVAKYSVDESDGLRRFVTVLEDGRSLIGNARLAGRSTYDLADPSQTVALYAADPDWPDGGVAAFCDGHAKRSSLKLLLKTWNADPFLKPDTPNRPPATHK